MHAVLTYRQLLLVSFLPPTVDHPPGRAEEGEEEEGKEGGGGIRESGVLDLWSMKLTAWADVTGTSLPGLVTVCIFNVSIATTYSDLSSKLRPNHYPPV